MITEDYVSFEIAKLLKEKGFDEECSRWYVANEPQEGVVENGFGENQFYINAPTLQMAMKWLREVHNIMVSPYALTFGYYFKLSFGYYFEIFDLTNRDITGCKPLYKVGIPNKENVLPTYEEACEAAIKYCLEHLI